MANVRIGGVTRCPPSSRSSATTLSPLARAGTSARRRDRHRLELDSPDRRRRLAEGAIQVVDEMKAAPRLAAGLGATGELSDVSIRAAIEALERMATLARQLGAERIDAVATSAVREASNASELPRGDRARHGAQGARARRRGRGSAQLPQRRRALRHGRRAHGRRGHRRRLARARAHRRRRDRATRLAALRRDSADRGLTSRTASRRKRVRRCAATCARRSSDQLPRRDWRGAQLIGSGGTFTNLAGIYLARQGILTARSVHAAHIPRADLEHILDMLAEMTAEERRRCPGSTRSAPTSSSRASPSRPRCCAASRRARSSCRATASAKGCCSRRRAFAPTIADPGEARARSVTEFATRCHVEQPHSSHVQKLALVLFDALGERLGCTKDDRAALADAALLHDCGYHISYERHHKHSYHLILHADLLGLAPSEQVVIANVARYHRGEEPKRKHRNFGMLDKSLRRRIKRLSALLRVADGFDRGHVSAVADLKVRWTQRALRITPVPANARDVDAPRDVGREPEVGAPRRARRRAGGDRRSRRPRRVVDRTEIESRASSESSRAKRGICRSRSGADCRSLAACDS